jgi:hypothetical protein
MLRFNMQMMLELAALIVRLSLACDAPVSGHMKSITRLGKES